MTCLRVCVCVGAVCRLYFDLEFYREFNPHKDGPAAVAVLVKVLLSRRAQTYFFIYTIVILILHINFNPPRD